MSILPPSPTLSWHKSGLFWRTFLLLTLLTALSVSSWVGMISAVHRGPHARQLAAQLISVVTITLSALTHSAPDKRRELLFELASNEVIRIYAREPSDLVAPAPNDALLPDIEQQVKDTLGADTRFSARVNGIAGFWVSFKIDEDEYWLMLEREPNKSLSGAQWLGWAALVAGFSLLGSALISNLVNRPLARLTAAARQIAAGKRPAPLPERGPTEVVEANRSFNQMVDDLEQVASDRAVILAGISHDLRTPLARMRLELEMANLSDEARNGMSTDIGQMDAIIGQFLDYAKPTDMASFMRFDLSALLTDAAHEAARQSDVCVCARIAPDIPVLGNATEVRRVINNLIENARRYAHTEGTDVTDLAIDCQVKDLTCGRRAVIDVMDRGPGVPDGQIPHMLKPFTRLDSARGQANGAGLGLAIVERVLARHRAELHVRNRDGGGLHIQILLPLAAPI